MARANSPPIVPDEAEVASLHRDAFDGDLMAREDFCRIMGPLLLLWAVRLLRCAAAREDIVQETLWKLLNFRFDPRKGTFFSVSRTILQREAITWFRRQRWTTAIEGTALADHRPTPQEVAMAEEERTKLVELVGDLSYEDQEVLRRRFEEGKKLRELAVLLNLPQGSLGRRLYGAMQRLRDRWTSRDAA